MIRKVFILLVLFFLTHLLITGKSFSQNLNIPELTVKEKVNVNKNENNRSNYEFQYLTEKYSGKNYLNYFYNINGEKTEQSDVTENSSSTLPIAIGVASFLYLLNPILLFENDKISGGITKEISLGFGDFGQHRFSMEYSYLFRQNLSSNLRFAYKYDILLKRGITPSNFLQGTSVLSLGAGYFTNFSNHGYFPELSFGYSIRNNKLLFYPNIKIRYTYVKNGSEIYDISAGIMLGFANPLIDNKIRRDDR